MDKTRSPFTPDQIAHYFDRIHLSVSARKFQISSLSCHQQLEYLSLLQKHHLVAIPFENLVLHYSWHRVVDLDLEHLFDKIVCQPGRGGYCMENNTLFHNLLVSLGFSCYMVGSRIYNPQGARYGGFSHCLNIVRIGETSYPVDVGYGANGPISPVKMSHGHIQSHVGRSCIRLRHDSLPQALNKDAKSWIYEHQVDEFAAWVPLYCFPDSEFFPEDIATINLSPSKSPTSFFLKKVICVRFTQAKEAMALEGLQRVIEGLDQRADIDGVLILNHNWLKWRRNGANVFEKELRNEAERLDALERFFGISLSKLEKRAIKGTIAVISDKAALPSAKYPGSLAFA
ncbi:arylamine n-acetyltransferase 2 [Fusarium albosuccineum]|uniref:Arylamine n-acetyltransferase 2 n=1 Tax=Fusarium albosuccineum TaxID=1237068 RepID=A0A8H4LCH7_9HYPO|nr:arylamine n-acetyltransferase 2 [Fusarium albosuccineum]